MRKMVGAMEGETGGGVKANASGEVEGTRFGRGTRRRERKRGEPTEAMGRCPSQSVDGALHPSPLSTATSSSDCARS